MKIIKFLLLTIWIAFVSITAQMFYSPDTYTQEEIVEICARTAEKDANINKNQYIYTYFHYTGGDYSVRLNKSLGKNGEIPNSISCIFNRDKKIEFMMVGGKSFEY